MLPDSTKECVNLASYNYLGFAENDGDCTNHGKCRIELTQTSLTGRGLPTPTPGREAKSLKNGIPILLHMK